MNENLVEAQPVEAVRDEVAESAGDGAIESVAGEVQGEAEGAAPDEAQAFFENAASFYALLSSIFYLELTEEQIDGLARSGFSFPDDGSAMGDACASLRRYLARRGPSARQDLAVDYARIFLAAGVYEGDTAVPYESVYTSPEGLMMQDSRDDVVRAYKRCGLVIPQDLNVPEDHLAFELEFMGHLSERIAKAFAVGEDASDILAEQLRFIDEHLLNWMPDLAKRVESFAKLPFYPAMMTVAISYVQENRAVLEEVLS